MAEWRPMVLNVGLGALDRDGKLSRVAGKRAAGLRLATPSNLSLKELLPSSFLPHTSFTSYTSIPLTAWPPLQHPSLSCSASSTLSCLQVRIQTPFSGRPGELTA